MAQIMMRSHFFGRYEHSREMSELTKPARDGKPSLADMSAAGFTTSCLGGHCGRYLRPIFNASDVVKVLKVKLGDRVSKVSVRRVLVAAGDVSEKKTGSSACGIWCF